MYVTCIGAGYVGAPHMAVFAKHCPDTTFENVDIDESKIAAWNSDSLPVYEPNLLEIVKEVRGRNLSFTTDLEGAIERADMIFVAVGTPTKMYGAGQGFSSELRYLEEAFRLIARVAKSPKIIVEKSTVPVRTGEHLHHLLQETSDVHFDILNNPEFLAEGTAIRDLEKPDRVVMGSFLTGSGKTACNRLADLYSNWIPRERIIQTDIYSSEVCKLIANAFLAQRISSINAVSTLCEHIGGNVGEIARCIGLDSRIGSKFLNASVGFGGSCFRKDISNLVHSFRGMHLEAEASYWEQVLLMNEHQKHRFARLILDANFGSLAGKPVTVFGFAFKANTGDTRDSPAIAVCGSLLEERASLRICDPKVTTASIYLDLREELVSRKFSKVDIQACLDRVTVERDPYEAVKGASAVAIVTEWDEFKHLDYAKIFSLMQRPAYIFDGRRILDVPLLRKIGFHTYRLGEKHAHQRPDIE